ncbi:hypothetical protein NEILACOT_05480 [Neisseria lactamica ATCC 23970]|uniref:Uncharacterized protein n=1 Tax=Neisseria lactamica ATCC 23970 TaxID=546265 RepID=D0WD44_NEILA|nr:hypothetical protein NEILACOT_05480 [Neisseria lactamica ATCC 23970]
MAVHIEMPSERCSDGIFYGFGFDFNLFCLKYSELNLNQDKAASRRQYK